ncbi:type I polyketide synthase [Niveispirillum sp. KHB5.9]|uniref:type I polyketide synthase n=1 Tax=Niveispirillum sp. KHB5.9 TaxID=3400269 RepID=UPI003A839883
MRDETLDPTRELLLLLEEAEARIADLEGARHAPIAVIGMGCRFPGAADIAAFWDLLVQGRSAVGRVPADRWDADAWYDPDPDAVGRIYTRDGGFLEQVDRFDAGFFGISPREAESLDPQHRLFLEVAAEALEDAGLPLDRLAGSSTGVYLGIGSGDYLRVLGDLTRREPYYGPGNAYSAAAGRLSYLLGLQGPCMAVDTACSSSLVAVHLAIQALRAGECDAALAGGVNLILSPETTLYFCRMGALARDGRCKSFDAAADGYVRGEGCGVVVLKRLSDALAAGDTVLAVLRGSAVNQDGRSNGLTVPNGPAQEAVIARALADAGVDAADISYVEAHGTGTSLGDPIEVNALARALRPAELRGVPLVLGAVKTNLGHLESAAGMAGLIKTVLALKHRTIPPVLNFTRPNPEIDWSAADLRVPTSARPWDAVRPVAGVSAFGFAGTNAHVVVEAAPGAPALPVADQPPALLLPLSARGPGALRDLAAAYLDRLSGGDDAAALCRATARRRAHHPHRLALTAADAAGLRAALAGWLEGGSEGEGWQALASAGVASRPRVVFIFPGQGGQWTGMARDLMGDPAFAGALEAASGALAPHLGLSVAGLIRAGAAWDRIDLVQPALFALQVALAALWRSRGIVPDTVVGHSMGEVAAAHVAGILSLEDGARIIALRSRLLSGIAGQGSMLLTDLSLEDAEVRIAPFRGTLSVAVANSRRSIVLAGDADDIDRLAARLEADGVFARKVRVDVASHSPQVDPLLPELAMLLRDLSPRDGLVTMLSTVTGLPVKGGELDADYWCRNLRQPVLFGAVVEGLVARGTDVLVELGPHPVLVPAMTENIQAAGRLSRAVACLRRDVPAAGPLAEAAGALYAAGAALDWAALLPGPVPPIDLPHYPWQRQRYWAEPVDGARTILPPPASAGQTEIGGYYDQGAAYHEARLAQGGVEASQEVLSGYLTWSLLPVRVPGFSWLRTVFQPEHDPAQQKLLVDGQRELRRLLFRGIEMGSLKSAFDFGCGYGSDLIDLAGANPGLSVEGYTLSARQAEIGNGRAAGLGLGGRVRLYQRDSAATPFPGTYDLVFGFEVSGLIADKASLFTNIRTHLAPGGRLILAEVLATGSSSVDLPELSTYSATTAQFAELLAGARMRLLSCTDVSGPIANCLYDGDFEDNLARVAADPAVDPALVRHVAMYPNVGRALDAGLMIYALMSAVHDPHAPVAELLAHNRGALDRPISYQDAHALLPDAAPDHASWLWRIDWRSAPLPPVGATGSQWLLVGGGEAERAALASALTTSGARVETVSAVPETVTRAFAGIVHLGALGLPGLTPAEERRQGVIGALHLVQGLARAGSRNPPRLWLATAGVQLDGAVPAQGPVWGLGRTVAHEHPELRCSLADLPPVPGADDWAAFARLLLADQPETQVVVRGGGLSVARLTGVAVTPGEPAALRRDGTYLVTGGLGGLGLAVAERLARAGAGCLVLTGRRPPGEVLATALDAIAATGVELDIRQVDVADRARMLALLDDIDRPDRPLRGVIHAAGSLDDGILLQQDAGRFERLLAAKQGGALILDEGTAGRSLDFFVLFSGLASFLGSPGQGNYAAANAALDAVARSRRSRGLPGLSINWSPWGQIGLVAGAVDGLAQRGVEALPAERGLDLLMRCLDLDVAELAVMSFDRRRWAQAYPALAASPLLSDIALPAAPVREVATDLRGALLAEPVGWARQGRLEAHLADVLARVLRLSPEAVERNTALKDLGFDSLMALETRNRLEADTGLKLPVTLVWKHPTVADLALHLAERMEVPLLAGAGPAASDDDLDSLDGLLDMLEGLSEDEAGQRYRAEG